METKSLGKIGAIALGMGGYDDAMFGVTVRLESPDGCCVDFKGTWAGARTQYTKWTEEDRQANYAAVMTTICSWLMASKVQSLDKLKGVPIEIVWEAGCLKSWRILTEVL